MFHVFRIEISELSAIGALAGAGKVRLALFQERREGLSRFCALQAGLKELDFFVDAGVQHRPVGPHQPARGQQRRLRLLRQRLGGFTRVRLKLR